MRWLRCGLIIAIAFVLSLVPQDSIAADDPLVAALHDYEQAVVNKLNSDLEIIARAFADARDIQKARRWADWAKLPLDSIHAVLKFEAVLNNPKNIVKELVKAPDQLGLLSYFFTLHTLWESAKGFKLALHGPKYTEAVRNMLAEADKTKDTQAYQDMILLYLHGLGGRTSPAPVVIETALG
jgi:hypothetical protein